MTQNEETKSSSPRSLIEILAGVLRSVRAEGVSLDVHLRDGPGDDPEYGEDYGIQYKSIVRDC